MIPLSYPSKAPDTNMRLQHFHPMKSPQHFYLAVVSDNPQSWTFPLMMEGLCQNLICLTSCWTKHNELVTLASCLTTHERWHLICPPASQKHAQGIFSML